MQTEDQKLTVPELAAGGNNWITYHDRYFWVLDTNAPESHLSNTSVPASYIIAGKFGGSQPEHRWRAPRGQIPRKGNGQWEGAAAAVEEKELEDWTGIDEVEECAEVIQGTAAAGVAGSCPARAEQARRASELYDFGASRHMSSFRERFVTYQSTPPRAITTADNRVFCAIGTGDLQIEVVTM